jgi:hypothetical protein
MRFDPAALIPRYPDLQVGGISIPDEQMLGSQRLRKTGRLGDAMTRGPDRPIDLLHRRASGRCSMTRVPSQLQQKTLQF